MSSNSSPKDRRGKTSVHGLKATPKSLRPVQPDHVYDSYDDERSARREERRARRHSAAPDFSTYGIIVFFIVLGLGAVFFLVQGGSTMDYTLPAESPEEIRAKNELTRKLNEERAREAALRAQQQPVPETSRSIPARQPAPAPASEPVRAAPRAVAPGSPSTAPTVSTPAAPATPAAGEAPRPAGGISAGMVPPEMQGKLKTEPRSDVPDAMKK